VGSEDPHPTGIQICYARSPRVPPLLNIPIDCQNQGSLKKIYLGILLVIN
jgi:hypothetical protein